MSGIVETGLPLRKPTSEPTLLLSRVKQVLIRPGPSPRHDLYQAAVAMVIPGVRSFDLASTI